MLKPGKHVGLTVRQSVSVAPLIRRHQYFVDSVYGNDGYSGTQRSKPWQTIARVNAAVEELVPTAVVRLQQGQTFSGTITVPSGGTSGDLITLGAYGSGAKPILNGGAATAITATAANRGYWRVQDLDLRCTGDVAGGARAIYHNYFDGPDPAAVPGWIIENCDFNCGIWINGPRAIIRNNAFDGTANAEAKNFIICRGTVSNRVLVSGNVIHDGFGRAVWIGVDADNCIVEGNTIYNISDLAGDHYGIDIDGYNGPIVGAIVRNNSITDCNLGILLENLSTSPQVYGNIVIESLAAGVEAIAYAAHDGVEDMQGVDTGGAIYNNILVSTVVDVRGLQILETAGWDMYHNTIVDCGMGLMFADGGAANQGGCRFFNNLLDSVSACIVFDAALTELEDHDYNCYYNAGGVSFVVRPWETSTLAQFQTATEKDSNALSDDPLLVNSGDYHLQAGSPCRGAGVNVGITEDYDGVPRGDPPTIGAYEYVE